MQARDKAALRLSIGLGIATVVAYGLALPMPFVVCVLTVVFLCKPGPPLPLGKGLVVAALFALFVVAGVVMVPLLEHYAFAGIVLTALILYTLIFSGQVGNNPLTMPLVISLVLIPIVGIADQALVSLLSTTLAIGVAVGVLVGGVSGLLFPDPGEAGGSPGKAAAAAAPDRDAARWLALRAVAIVMPVFVLALTNPSFYLAAVMKTVALGQQAGEVNARSAGRELVGSTLMGALIALAAWLGLSLWPTLWMLALWLMAAALWTGSGMQGIRATRFRPSFWSNALITTLILLGPAIEDSASGKSVLAGAAVRTTLFIGVALYAWATVWVLERWRATRCGAISAVSNAKET